MRQKSNPPETPSERLVRDIRRAIYRRRVEQHRAWMIRAYAISMGAATISFIMLPIFLITGEAPVGYGADLLFVLSWVINLSIAEWTIRRLSARPLAIQYPLALSEN